MMTAIIAILVVCAVCYLVGVIVLVALGTVLYYDSLWGWKREYATYLIRISLVWPLKVLDMVVRAVKGE